MIVATCNTNISVDKLKKIQRRQTAHPAKNCANEF